MEAAGPAATVSRLLAWTDQRKPSGSRSLKTRARHTHGWWGVELGSRWSRSRREAGNVPRTGSGPSSDPPHHLPPRRPPRVAREAYGVRVDGGPWPSRPTRRHHGPPGALGGPLRRVLDCGHRALQAGGGRRSRLWSGLPSERPQRVGGECRPTARSARPSGATRTARWPGNPGKRSSTRTTSSRTPRFNPTDRSRAEALAAARLAGVPAGAWILDVPCGYGRHAVALAVEGYHVVGLDRSPTQLDEARRRRGSATEPRLESGLSYRQIPLAGGTFDGALLLHSSLGYTGGRRGPGRAA